MIIEAVVNVLVLVVLGVISIFPTIPAVDLSFLDGVFQLLSLVDTFVSVSILSGCLVTIFVVNHAQLLWSVIMWVVRKIPGLS